MINYDYDFKISQIVKGIFEKFIINKINYKFLWLINYDFKIIFREECCSSDERARNNG